MQRSNARRLDPRSVRSDTRIVLTSGFAGKGLVGFLRKPFRAQDLLDLVHRALAS